jgi:hypothetical protein
MITSFKFQSDVCFIKKKFTDNVTYVVVMYKKNCKMISSITKS